MIHILECAKIPNVDTHTNIAQIAHEHYDYGTEFEDPDPVQFAGWRESGWGGPGGFRGGLSAG